MKNNLSDKQLDRLMRTLAVETSANEATMAEVADSRATWWGIQRRINEQKGVTRSPWPPKPKLWRWVMAGVPLTAVAALAISFAVIRSDGDPEQVLSNGNINNAVPAKPGVQPEPVADRVSPAEREVSKTTAATKAYAKRTASREVKRAKPATEIKTEFIALSYAQNPESGQIVRIKVPSSMMVALGLVASVDKPGGLVNAEVIIGDDGLTHAIRFIR